MRSGGLGSEHVKALVLMLVLAVLTLAAGCGDDETSTSSTGAGSGGDEALNAAAQTAARKAQTAIESYADKNGSYAGASAQALSEIDPSVSAGDLEVVSTDSSYTITVASASGTTFSIDGEQGGATERTCDPPGDPGCSENGDWG
jgi:hypothetical protein